MKRYRQIEESKKMIQEAFLRLLQEHNMNEISISMSARKAKLARNTFCNHYQKKEDVLYDIMNGILNEAKSVMKKEGEFTVRNFLIYRFNFIKQNPLISIFHKHQEIQQLFLRFQEEQTTILPVPLLKDSYRMQFLEGGIGRVTSKWVMNGMKETPEKMADEILSFFQSAT